MANYDGAMISTEELKTVLNSLKSQRDIIINEYRNSIKNVLNSSSSCFRVSGINIDTIISIFDDTFNNLDRCFEILIDALENNVIKNYSELAIAIRKMFDDNFASKIMSLLNYRNDKATQYEKSQVLGKYQDLVMSNMNK